MTITQKQRNEIDLTRRLIAALGYSNVAIEPSDRPDVIAQINGMNIGIEVTQFHADEHAESKGSRMRADEEALARQSPAKPYFMWGVADPLPGLVARIQDKIARAAAYDPTRYSELWLLISSQVPMPGALATTFLFAPFLNVSKLNDATHGPLSSSPFAAVHLHLVMSHDAFYSWSREKQWHTCQVANG